MTRSDLVNQLAERFGQLTQRDSEFAVKTMLDAMSDALGRGHRIEIRGFGSFSINRRPPRLGRNPRSGEKVMIPEKLVPHFANQWTRTCPRATKHPVSENRQSTNTGPARGLFSWWTAEPQLTCSTWSALLRRMAAPCE